MTLFYNVPADRLKLVKDAGVIIRSHDQAALVQCAADVGLDRIVHLQLLSLDHAPHVLQELTAPIPLELVVEDVTTQYALLYRYADLLKTRPIRVRVPLQPGFGKVVKVAAAVEFPVILEAGQPERTIVEEMMMILDTYLHQTTMAAPVEFFHSLLMAYFGDEQATLWEIQDEDPAVWRYVTDDGTVVISKRLSLLPELAEINAMDDIKALVPTWNSECVSCHFLTHCQGYFKLPDTSYHCREIVKLLRLIEEAGQDLRKDYDASLRTGGGRTP
ncbi:hypothetical protein ACFL2Q_12590 [Thermodesulfobacteriota bacterium]